METAAWGRDKLATLCRQVRLVGWSRINLSRTRVDHITMYYVAYTIYSIS